MFEDLEIDIKSVPVARHATQQHKCDKCHGTGVFHFGYHNPRSGKCHACNGRGSFATSSQHRAKARAGAANRRAKKVVNHLELFAEQQPAAHQWLTSARGDFAASLLESVRKYGSLTERQLSAVHNIIAKDNAPKPVIKPAAVLNLAPVFERFKIAQSKGIKRPKMNVIDFQFSLAPEHGRNAGHLYVKSGEQYVGKVSGEGEFFRAREISDDQVEALKVISQDVLLAARAYGQKHGQCSMCRRSLTNEVSIALAMGPVCADNWGFPHDLATAKAKNPEFFEPA